MNIGIIGAGHIGAALAKKLVALGHHVSIANSRGPDTLGDVATATGAKAATVHDAAKAGELVIVTIPQKAIPDLPKDLFAGVPESVVVIDTCNYYPMLRDGALAGDDMIDSEWTATHLGRPVIKAFNSIMASSLTTKGSPRGTPGRVALAVSGDRERFRRIVLQLVDALGFDPVDNGSLANSWRQQPGTPSYGRDFDKAKLTAALASAEHDKIGSYRRAGEESTKAHIAATR